MTRTSTNPPASHTTNPHEAPLPEFDFSLLSDAELLEYIQLQKALEIDNRWRALNEIISTTPINYAYLFRAYHDQKYQGEKLIAGYKGVVLEGSARSAKTFSSLKFICKVCRDSHRPLIVNIIKDTLNEFKNTLYNDFRVLLTELGLDNPFERLKEVNSFRIGNSYVNFLGADQPAKFMGNSCDILYFNEVLPIDKFIFTQTTMRCNLFWIADYNPSLTEHWIYEVPLRDDVGFLRTTFRDNPDIPVGQKNEIIAYEPWLPGSYQILNDVDLYYNGSPITDKNQPPPHPENVRQGTANEFQWRVFGLGLRGAMAGVIFPQVHWITREECPTEGHIYGNDFGFTNDPNALCRYWEDADNIWIEPLSYQPIDAVGELVALFESVGVEDDVPIACDSSDKYTGENKGTVEMVRGLKEAGYPEAFKISKRKSVMYWLGSMKKKRIHVVKNHLYKHIKKEQENYKFKEVNGIPINQPLDQYNHFWDGSRYGHMAYNDCEPIESEWS